MAKPRFSISVLLAFLALSIFSLTRVALLVYTGTVNVPLTLWPWVLIKGLLFDAAVLAYILSPFLFVAALMADPFRRRRGVSGARFALLSAATFLLLFNAAAEILFWVEFKTRFNFIALDYLIYTTEVLLNIWQSYPIVWILLGLAILSVIAGRLMHRRSSGSSGAARSMGRRVALAAAAVLLPWAATRYVRVQMMDHQGNAYAQELSGNGLFTLAAAVRSNELDYDSFYATIPQEKADRILRGLGVVWNNSLERRRHAPQANAKNSQALPFYLKRRPRHVVLISVESLSAHYLGAYGSKDGLTPRLDALAKDGVVFTNLFATGTRTVRGLDALSLSTPPIPGQAIMRRPKNSHLNSVGEMLSRQNFQAYFFYGGHGYFDNMNAFFSANGYNIRDRSSIPSSSVVFENVWGVADETLFNNTLSVLDEASKTDKPMFAHIMTTSNHRPYTYPDGRIDIPSPGGRSGAVKYTDYALGKFIDDARAKPWFKDTLFVIVADHCASVAGKTDLPVAEYKIPLIFYGPDLLKPARIDRMISQIDIAPTLFRILGVAGSDNFFGKDVLDQSGAPRAFISTYEELGYYKNNQLVVLKPLRVIEGYTIDPITLAATPATPNPDLTQEAIAYYQTASRAFKHGDLELLWDRAP